MRTARQAIALDPRLFGRRPPPVATPVESARALGDDLRLFAVTFAGGFLFVSVLVA